MINIIANLLFLICLVICVVASIKNKINNDNSIIEKYGKIVAVLIFICSAISITYKVNDLPKGLHVDEAGALYDAICISKYGVDRYLYKLPVYFINFGGGQNALYTYLAAILIKIFGVSTMTFRLPAIILSLVSMICFYKMVDENNSRKEALFGIFILAISPWFIMKSRWGLESYLMCSLMTISTFVFVKALNFNKKWLYALSGVLFGLTLYTYAISYIVVPVVIGVVLLYMLIIKKTNIKNIIYMAIPLGVLAIPLLMMLAYNSGIIENAQIPIFSIPKLWFYRGGEISFRNIPQNMKNIFELLFIKDFLNYNAIAEFGTLYKLSIPLVILGLIESVKNVIKDIKQKEFSVDFIMLVTFLVAFGTGLCIAEPNINKINAIYIPMIYFAGKFLCYISNYIKFGALVIVLLYCLNGAIFISYYFTEFANTDLVYFENDIIEASKRAEELKKDKIYIKNCLNQTYIYTLIATPISPYEFNENLQIQDGIVTAYGKYQFKIPEEINKNAVYIIKNNSNKINELIEDGFNVEQYGEFKVLWSE